MSDFTELLIQKKSRKKPKAGDVFSLRIKDDLYYYGKVIKTEIESTNVFLRGWNLVHIYDHSTSKLIEPSEINLINQSLILPPVVTNNKGWIDGYFFTVGSIHVIQKDLSIDYGFWDDIKKIYRLEGGETINRVPKLITDYALVSYGGIGRALIKIMNKEEHNL